MTSQPTPYLTSLTLFRLIHIQNIFAQQETCCIMSKLVLFGKLEKEINYS